jgi:hypothetical protein
MTVKLINRFSYRNRLTDVLRFIFNPKYDTTDTFSGLDKLATVVFLTLITLVFSLSSHFAIYYFLQPRPSAEFLDFITKYSPVGFFLLSVIYIPFIEETYYRLPLKFNPFFISIASSIFFYRMISKYIFNVSYYNFNDFIFSRIMFATAGAFIVYFILGEQRVKGVLQYLWIRYFKFIFYFICFLFAWIHISNFDSSSYNIFLIPILTLPQFFLGLTTGFVRVRYGFIYAFLLHAFYNSSQYWLPF